MREKTYHLYNAIAKHSKMCFEAVRAFTENTKIDNRVV